MCWIGGQSLGQISCAGIWNANVLKAAGDAAREGIVGILLVGDGENMERLLPELGLEGCRFQIESSKGTGKPAALSL